MAELTIDFTYGSALFQAANEVNKVDLIMEESHELLKVFESEPALFELITMPTVGASEKKETLKAIFEGRICNELLNFLYILVDKGRAKHYKKIVDAYTELVNQEEGYAYGKVLSVAPLKAEQIEKLEKETGKLMKQNIKLENEIDKSLIGGFKIYIDGKIIDASIANRFKNLELKLN